MGCTSSKHTLERVDDSVHVMLAHERKVAMRKGEAVASAFVPRAEHPLLAQQQKANEQQQTTVAAAAVASTVDNSANRPATIPGVAAVENDEDENPNDTVMNALRADHQQQIQQR